MEKLVVPLVGCVAEHETLITSAKLRLFLVAVDGGSDVGILGVDVGDDLAVCTVKTDSLRGVANTPADLSSDLLEVDLLVCHAGLTEKHNLQNKSAVNSASSKKIGGVKELTMPVLVAVSMATFALGSTRRQASRIPSET